MKNEIELKVSGEKKGRALPKSALKEKLQKIEINLHRTLKNLKMFEEKYKMKSNPFYKKFIKGELPENDDFIDWQENMKFIKNSRKKKKSLEIC